jgi:hypothetical protein
MVKQNGMVKEMGVVKEMGMVMNVSERQVNSYLSGLFDATGVLQGTT